MHRRIVIGISGASGAAYATRLIQMLAQAEVEVHVAARALGRRILSEELDIRKTGQLEQPKWPILLKLQNYDADATHQPCLHD